MQAFFIAMTTNPVSQSLSTASWSAGLELEHLSTLTAVASVITSPRTWPRCCILVLPLVCSILARISCPPPHVAYSPILCVQPFTARRAAATLIHCQRNPSVGSGLPIVGNIALPNTVGIWVSITLYAAPLPGSQVAFVVPFPASFWFAKLLRTSFYTDDITMGSLAGCKWRWLTMSQWGLQKFIAYYAYLGMS